MKAPMKKTGLKPLITHAPATLARKLDAAAKRAGRSRSAEIKLRLEESLARDAAAAALQRQPAAA